jgi:hypothetical protein
MYGAMTLNDGNGYWVYLRSADTLYVNGTVMTFGSVPPAYPLLVGWNLVGFKSQPNATEPKTVTQFTFVALNATNPEVKEAFQLMITCVGCT